MACAVEHKAAPPHPGGVVYDCGAESAATVRGYHLQYGGYAVYYALIARGSYGYRLGIDLHSVAALGPVRGGQTQVEGRASRFGGGIYAHTSQRRCDIFRERFQQSVVERYVYVVF